MLFNLLQMFVQQNSRHYDNVPKCLSL